MILVMYDLNISIVSERSKKGQIGVKRYTQIAAKHFMSIEYIDNKSVNRKCNLQVEIVENNRLIVLQSKCSGFKIKMTDSL